MLRFENTELFVVIVFSRFLELAGIVISIFLILKGYRLRYVIATAGIVALSLSVSLTGLLFKEYFYYIAGANAVLTASLLAGLLLYVVRNPEKTRDFTPPKNARCPVCDVLILKEEGLCSVKIDDYTYYLDSCDHLVKFLKNVDFLMEKGVIYGGELKEVYIKAEDTGRWKKPESVKVVEENGTYRAYENPPEGAKVLDLKELLGRAEDLLRRG
ncbi:MAG: hypothetical protein GXN96_01760 [Aquificae bacterium]|nr:hypothetical protein [Aquificota bacterium]